MTRFFLDCNNGISPQKVERLVEEWGSDILIGVDPGLEIDPDDDAEETIEAAEEAGARLHVYIVGPGMLDWSSDEARQIKLQARSVAIDTKNPSWHKAWLSGGWFTFVKRRIRYYGERGFYSFEIDNLDQIVDQDPQKTVDLYKKIDEFLIESKLSIRLMMKNLSPQQLDLVIAAVEDGTLRQDMFCEWAMFEKGSGDPHEQIALCAKLGIAAVTPISGITPTDRYGTTAKGVPSIRK